MTEVSNPKVQYRVEGGWADALTGEITPLFSDWPTDSNVGVDAIPGWEPTTTVTDPAGYIYLLEPDAVYTDVRFSNLYVIARAANITFRRCEFLDSVVDNNYGMNMYNRMTLEDCTIRYSTPGVGIFAPGLQTGGYTTRRTALLGVTEGFRVSGAGYALADPSDPLGYEVRLIDSYCRITGPVPCEGIDYHGDAFQSLDSGVPGGGLPLTIRNVTLRSVDAEDCPGNSCVISGYGHMLPANVNRLLCSGGIIPFRMNSGGDFTEIYIEDDSWLDGYFPIDITPYWSIIGEWSAWTCTLDVNGQVDTKIGSFPHDWSWGDPLDPP